MLLSMINQIRFRRKFQKSVIYRGVLLDNLCRLGDYSVVFKDSVLMDVSLGKYSYIQSKCVIISTEIGSFCSIASGVHIGLGVHPTHMVSSSPVFYDNTQPLPKYFVKGKYFTDIMPRTTIGPDVWIGHGVLIKAGVNIGIGSVIGAGSIVTKNIPPYVIAAGNPCKQIRLRFSNEISSRLIASEWWTLSDNILLKLAPFFTDPLIFLDKLDSLKC